MYREPTGSGEGEREGAECVAHLSRFCYKPVRRGGEVNPTKITRKSQVDVLMVCPSP